MTIQEEIKQTEKINEALFAAGVAGLREKLLRIIVDCDKGLSTTKEAIKLIKEEL